MRIIEHRPEIRRTYTGRAVVLEREHWDGAQDVKVTPNPIRGRVKPSWRDYLQIMEFEDAAADLRAARTSGDHHRIMRASYRFQKAQEAMTVKVRFGERVTETIANVL